MKRQMMSATVQPKEQASVEQLESRIVQVVYGFSLSTFAGCLFEVIKHFLVLPTFTDCK